MKSSYCTLCDISLHWVMLQLKTSKWTNFLLVTVLRLNPTCPPISGLHAAWRMCRGGLRIVGLITRGQVLDWSPPAVLFYPIRNSICCPTQLLSGHTPHPHRWSIVCVCALALLPINKITLVRGKRELSPESFCVLNLKCPSIQQ